MSLVLDTSATLAWIYPGEQTASISEVFFQLTATGAWVTSLWRLEVANSLEMGVRRGRITASFQEATLADLALLPIKTDPETERHAWHTTLQLAQRHRLTVYDAAYLELAIRRRLPLATLDQELRVAAKIESVDLLGE